MKSFFRQSLLGGISTTLLLAISGNYAAAEPRRGGEVVYLQSSFPPCLDVSQSARAQNATRQALDTLLDQDKNTGEVLPWLATDWGYEDAGRKLLLTLRKDVTFSNGERFDAVAVKANLDKLWELAQAGQASQALSYLSGYEGADVLADDKIAIHFKEAKAGFLQALTEKTLAPLAPETLSRTPEERCAGALIGTGPFVISNVIKNDRIELSRRDDYNWSSSNALHNGPAYLNRISIRTVSEGSVRVGALLSGQAQIIDEPPTDDLDRIKAQGAKIVARTAGGVGITLYPNIAHSVLSDEAVRRAFQKGIDRKEIVEALYSEYDTPSTSILSSTVPGQVDLGSLLKYDPEEASSILENAGWVRGVDGVRAKDGNRLAIEVLWSFPGYTSTLELAREQLKPIGIELVLNQRPDSEIGGLTREGKYQLRLSDLTRPDPDVLNSVFGGTKNSANFVPVPEINELLSAQSKILDFEKRAESVRKVQQLILEKGYAFPIKESVTILATSPKISDAWLSTPRWPVLYDTWLAE
ncbi:ABC transporter substrate-binding protein [Brucella sp. NBRC 12950]|uniref:ABC transporter substrate-binding protein n=1 Tax=Brucella sp. NBRC 12950 TaxID=2994518 RepID=UPI0024A44A1F|nr:ABC transporter substrate-binding protein [Brucella sp. NBRC 12950]GLU29156.1 ABC transporter substrate-binding protein [Brucella sp. NBRC 12950]